MNVGRGTATQLGDATWPRFAAMVLGVWLFISAFLWRHSSAQYWNAIICGVLAVIFAGAAMANRQARYLNTLLGIWVFISSFALVRSRPGTAWNDLIVGVLLVAVSLVPGMRGARTRDRALAH